MNGSVTATVQLWCESVSQTVPESGAGRGGSPFQSRCGDGRGAVGDRHIFQPIAVISGSTCSYWLRYAVLLSNRWHHYKLTDCWSKWLDLRSNTRLYWQLESYSARPVDSAATFPATVSSHLESLMQTELKRMSDNEINKTRVRAKTGRGGWSGVASYGVSYYG